MHVCAKCESDICFPSYFVRTITHILHPRELPTRANNQLLPEPLSPLVSRIIRSREFGILPNLLTMTLVDFLIYLFF